MLYQFLCREFHCIFDSMYDVFVYACLCCVCVYISLSISVFLFTSLYAHLGSFRLFLTTFCFLFFPINIKILKTLFEIVLFEDCGNQWSLSRPMLSLILISEQVMLHNLELNTWTSMRFKSNWCDSAMVIPLTTFQRLTLCDTRDWTNFINFR